MIGDFAAEMIAEYSKPYIVHKTRETGFNKKTELDERGFPIEEVKVKATVYLHIQNPRPIDLENIDTERNQIIKAAFSFEKLDYKDRVEYKEKLLSVESIKEFEDEEGTKAFKYILVSTSMRPNVS